MKILITGGSGNIGAYVIKELKDLHELIILDLKASKIYPDIPLLEVDLLDENKVKDAVKGFDAVIHLAAIPHPFNDPGGRVLTVNVAGTYNLLEAVRQNKIVRMIFAGSESASGFGIHNVPHKPLYFPIDEEHPSWPHESYSFSKYFGEIMCGEYSRAYGIEVISLRYAWVWVEQSRKTIEEIIKNEGVDLKNWFGAYVFPEDVALACRLALGYTFAVHPPFETFYITAAETFQKIKSMELIRRLYPEGSPPIKDLRYFEKNPYASLFNITKAREKLGFEPQKNWREG